MTLRILGFIIPLIAAISLLCGAVVLVALPISAAEIPLPEEVRILYHEVTEEVLLGEYKDAQTAVTQFISMYPESPVGPLMAASVIQYAAVDYEDFSHDDEFFDLIDETIARAEAYLNKHPDDQWAVFYRAAANGLAGAHASLTGRMLSGIIRGRAGANAMNRIIEADSTFYDAYLMAGSYHFWRSVATTSIDWLPFIDDEKEKGIAEAELAVANGELAGPLANTVLLEMLLEYDPDRALRLAEDLTGRYPSCRLFAWQLGEAYKRLERFVDACAVFEQIAASMRDDPVDDGSGELRCWWKLADLAYALGDCELSAEYCRLVIALGERPAVARSQHDRIERARHILEDCNI